MEKTKTSHLTPEQAALPDGFQQSGSAAAVGWFDQGTVGNTVSGKLTGMFQRKDSLRTEGTSEFFQVQVDKACRVRAERGEDAKFIEAKPGDFVNVNYGPRTKAWKDFIPAIQNGAIYVVYGIVVSEKIPIGNGKKMHNINTGHKCLQPPREQDDGVGAAFEDPTSAAPV